MPTTDLTFAIRAVNEAQKALKDVQDQIGGVERKLDDATKAGGGLKGMFADMTKVAGGFVLAQGITQIPGLFSGATGAASDLNEALSKSNTIFGENAREIEQWASGAARDFGQSKRQALDAAGTFGNLFSQLGIGSQESAKMSMSITELASDFASFHNADISQVIEAQTAAFRGEYDALQRFIPTINAASVEQKAMAMTGKENKDQLTEQDKALAVHALMLENAGAAAGDFDRTSGELANKQRIVQAEFENLKARIGQGLLPVMVMAGGFILDTLIPAFGSVASVVSTVVGPAIGFLRDNSEYLVPVLAGIAAAITVSLVPAVLAAIPAIYAKAAAWTAAAAAMIAANAPMLAVAAAIGIAVAAIVLIIQHWDDLKAKFPILQELEDLAKRVFGTVASFITDTLVPAVEQIGTIFGTVFDTIVRPIVEGFVSFISGQIGAAQTVLEGIITFLTGVFTGDWDKAWEGIKLIAQGIVDSIKSYFETQFDLMKGAVLGIVDLLKGELGSKFGEIKDAISGKVTDIYNDVTGFFGDMRDDVNAIAGDARDWVTDRFGELYDNTVGKAGDIYTDVLDFFSDLRDDATDRVTTLKDNIFDRFSTMKDDALGFAGDIKDGVLGKFEDIRDEVGGIVRTFGNNQISGYNNILGGIESFVNRFGDAINWVSSKLGMGDVVPDLNLPRIPMLATGAKNFPGGYAIVGEEGPELVKLPGGADVLTARQTKALTRAVTEGVAIGGIGDLWDKAKDAGSAIKDLPGDIAGGIREVVAMGAGKLVDTAFSAIGLSAPSFPGALSGVGGALFDKLKDALVDLVEQWIKDVKDALPTATGEWAKPLAAYTLTQGFGKTDFSDAYASGQHSGVDLAAARGTPIFAADGGTVTLAGWNGGYGNAVMIDHGEGLSSLYGHMERILTTVGTVVDKLDTIGTVDSTGFSTGDHLHFEARRNGVAFDPREMVALARGVRNFRGGMALVGEEGPELVSLPRGANVYSNAETRALARPSVTVNIEVDARGAQQGVGAEIEEAFKRLIHRWEETAFGDDALAWGITGGAA